MYCKDKILIKLVRYVGSFISIYNRQALINELTEQIKEENRERRRNFVDELPTEDSNNKLKNCYSAKQLIDYHDR